MVKSIDRFFLGSAIVCALVGLSGGLIMGMTQNFTLASAHAHLNLVGWVSLALFGLAYRSGIAVCDRLAVVHYFVAVSGAVLLPIGIALALLYQQPVVAILGSLLTLASMIIFATNFLRQRNRNSPSI
jgi:hypothetical protein